MPSDTCIQQELYRVKIHGAAELQDTQLRHTGQSLHLARIHGRRGLQPDIFQRRVLGEGQQEAVALELSMVQVQAAEMGESSKLRQTVRTAATIQPTVVTQPQALQMRECVGECTRAAVVQVARVNVQHAQRQPRRLQVRQAAPGVRHPFQD